MKEEEGEEMEKASLRFSPPPPPLLVPDKRGFNWTSSLDLDRPAFIKFLCRIAVGLPLPSLPKKSGDFKLSYRCIISHDHKNFGKFTTSVNFDTVSRETGSIVF